MDHEAGAASNSLTQALRDRPYGFDFFQAVRRLECAHRKLPRIGRSQRPQDDPVRFCQNVFLGFAPSSLHSYVPATDDHPAKVVANFLGLLGTNGPMPLAITEYIYDRLHNHADKTLASFLDVFNHRMICLFYRAWACNQQTVSHDRPEEDRFAVYVGSLLGLGEESLRKRDAVPDNGKFHYSGRLACQTKNAEGLQAILQGYFAITAEIEQFIGQWILLPHEHRCRLGESPENATLGSTVVIGSRFWECQQKFRIRFGPMNLPDYQRMLPGGDSIQRLIGWVRNYVGEELSWELQLILRAREVPRTCLGQLGQLGWSTWLITKKLERDADDLMLRGLVA